jgi:DNA repair protein RadC
MTIHKDHRRRVKARFLSEGLDHFDELHALELLLFFAIPQGDVNPLAHTLLDHFGNLHQVLKAPPEQLKAVKGIGEHTAILLGLVKGLSQKYLIDYDEKAIQLRTLEECGAYLLDRFLGRRNETVMLLCLDAKRAPLACRIVSEGSVNTTEVSVRKVVEAALAVNATSVLLAHNHPSGIAVPSMEDIVTTRRMAMALDAVGIPLEDHIVVAGRDYVSLVRSNYYNPEQCRMMV